MVKMTIDGSHHTGLYRVDCQCDAYWTGEGEPDAVFGFSPTLPIAECVAHLQLCHPQGTLDVRFQSRFSQWLLSYWDKHSRRYLGALGAR